MQKNNKLSAILGLFQISKIFRIFATLAIFSNICTAQPWVMFSDGSDTYLYDQASGQVYIRTKRGGANYEDTFVKMGENPKNAKNTAQSSKNTAKEPPKAAQKNEPKSNPNATQATAQTTQNAQEEQRKLIEKAQELQRSIQGSIFGAN